MLYFPVIEYYPKDKNILEAMKILASKCTNLDELTKHLESDLESIQPFRGYSLEEDKKGDLIMFTSPCKLSSCSITRSLILTLQKVTGQRLYSTTNFDIDTTYLHPDLFSEVSYYKSPKDCWIEYHVSQLVFVSLINGFNESFTKLLELNLKPYVTVQKDTTYDITPHINLYNIVEDL